MDSFTSDNGFLKIKGFKYSYSPKDDYFFINPQPKLESLNDYYNGHGKPLTPEQLDNSLNEYNKKGRPFEMVEHYSRYLRKFGKFSGNYLDFGCAGGCCFITTRPIMTCMGWRLVTLPEDIVKNWASEWEKL